LAEVSLSEERFEEVKSFIFGVTGTVEAEKNEMETKMNDEEAFPLTSTVSTFPESCLVLQ
ncbi:hypothetical protein T12_16025, partial [Trichinella patagoniensis]